MEEFIDELLKQRGIQTEEEKDIFFNPNYERDLHDPFLLKDMDVAVKRILKAIEKKEKIAIYSDFDADGIPAGALLHDFFKKVGHEDFINYIPLYNQSSSSEEKQYHYLDHLKSYLQLLNSL